MGLKLDALGPSAFRALPLHGCMPRARSDSEFTMRTWSLVSQSKPHLDSGSWETDLLFVDLKSQLPRNPGDRKGVCCLALPQPPALEYLPAEGGPVWSAGAHTWIPAIACHGWWELMAWALCQGERQGRGSPCRWLSKGQVGEAPPCLGIPGATGHFWYIYLWRRDMCFGNLKVLAIQSCPTLCDPMDCNLPGSCVHGIFQARILEWVAILFSRGSSRPRDRTRVSCIADRFFTRKP